MSNASGMTTGVAVGGAIVTAGVLAATVSGLQAPAPAQAPTAESDAARFLIQATFGPTDAAIAGFNSMSPAGWCDDQSGQPSLSFLNWVNRRDAEINAADPLKKARAGPAQVQEAFFAALATSPDQLRQRMAFALSQIFVISYTGTSISARIGAAYYDMLMSRSFGNYFDLLKAVTLSGGMGMYLNIIGNQQADNDPTRHPDENYAREVMQLMSIGLFQLNMDGSQALDGNGQPIPSYTHNDIAGFAKVFTGLGWYAKTQSLGSFSSPQAGSDVLPLAPYPQYHSLLSKTVLGVTLPAYGSGSQLDYQTNELDAALRVLFNHPNVPPFVALRLIQRFVTSNPSPSYIQRVAQAFADNGGGVRGDLMATIKAVLTDDEARNRTVADGADYGKLREPIIRLGNFVRAFGAQSPSGNFLGAGNFGGPTSLNQEPLAAPSVFNFWTPFYAQPDSKIAANGLVAPEFQAVDVLSVAGYANTILSYVQNGGWGADLKTNYPGELALAPTPTDLVPAASLANRLNRLLCGGQMSTTLYNLIVSIINSTTPASQTAANIAAANLNRVRNAVALTMVSTDYIVQR